jgi:aspartyl-tRNA(Asn)/glutamyl-tRNA(Gln) amidotransferase subunit A
MDDLLDLPLADAAGRMRAGGLVPLNYAATWLQRIDRLQPELNAFLHVGRDALSEPPPAGQGALAGIPIGIKDNIVTTDAPTTCASRILSGFRSPYDATVVARLRAAGAFPAGKMNLDEFAMGSSTEHSAYGVCRNPWDVDRVPGGSSGGSAAAVAARMLPVALGSDTGGSVRQPAALCGIVGLKPTYGRVSRYGLVAFASSLDQIGVLSRSVEDAASVLQVIAGHDPTDSTSSTDPVPDYSGSFHRGVSGLRFGVVREAGEHLKGTLRENFDSAAAVLRAGGAEVKEISIPSIEHAIAVYYVVANAEASANLARFDGMRYGRRAEGPLPLRELYARSRGEGFGAEVKRRIMLGTFVLSSGYYDAYYGRAQAVRELMKHDFARAFEQCDFLLTPTAPEGAFRIGERSADPLSMYLSDIFTAPANLVGIPAIAVPSGFDDRGLPLSLQIMARHFDEQRLLGAAQYFQSATDHWKRRPPNIE